MIDVSGHCLIFHEIFFQCATVEMQSLEEKVGWKLKKKSKFDGKSLKQRGKRQLRAFLSAGENQATGDSSYYEFIPDNQIKMLSVFVLCNFTYNMYL